MSSRLSLVGPKHAASIVCALLALLAASTAGAQSVSSQVTDPQGDAFSSQGNGNAASPALDIIAASFAVDPDSTITLTMDLAGPLSVLPDVPSGSKQALLWGFQLDTDPSTSIPGYPVADGWGWAIPPEFIVVVTWDGMAFGGVFMDRRPLLVGGPVLQFAVPVLVSVSRITVTVPAALAAVVQPQPGAQWVAKAGWWSTAQSGNGNAAIHIVDVTAWSPWPHL